MKQIENSDLYFTVYQTTNLINGKIYIGMHKTRNLDDDYLGSGKVLNQAIKKYGRKNFKREILFLFHTEEEMRQKEAEIVTLAFIARKDTYNLTCGGKGGFYYINNVLRKTLLGTKKREERRFDYRSIDINNHGFIILNRRKIII